MLSLTDQLSRFSANDVKINDKYDILQNKYEWRISDNICKKCIHYSWYFLSGFVLYIIHLVLIILMLSIMFIAFISYVFTCCYCGKYKSLGFINTLRLFIGTQRLKLMSNPKSSRNWCWTIQHRIIGFYQISEYLYHYNSLTHLITSYYHTFNNNNNHKNDDNNTTVFPFMFSIVHSNYNAIDNAVHAHSQYRDGTFASMIPSTDLEYYLFPQVLNTTDPRHAIMKTCLNCLLQKSDANSPPTISEHFMQKYFEYLRSSSAATTYKRRDYHFNCMHFGALWYQIFNIELTENDLFYIAQQSLELWPFIGLPDWYHFLFGNNNRLRCLYDLIAFVKKLIKTKGGNKYKELVHLCNQNWVYINMDAFLNGIAMSLIDGNMKGSIALYFALKRYHDNNKEIDALNQEIRRYEMNKKAYILEIIRCCHNEMAPIVSNMSHITPVHSFVDKRGGGNSSNDDDDDDDARHNNKKSDDSLGTSVPDDFEFHEIRGKIYRFPIGCTIIGSAICLANQDESYFGDQTNQFKMGRNLDASMSFHCKEAYFGNKQALKMAERYCFGHDVFIDTITCLLDKIYGSEMHIMDQNLEKQDNDQKNEEQDELLRDI